MRLELSIVSIIFVIFLSLNYLIPDTQTTFIPYNDTIAINNSKQITDSDYIIEQIKKSNSTNKDITNLSKKDEMILKEELEKSNELFIKLVNESSLKSENSTSNTTN